MHWCEQWKVFLLGKINKVLHALHWIFQIQIFKGVNLSEIHDTLNFKLKSKKILHQKLISFAYFFVALLHKNHRNNVNEKKKNRICNFFHRCWCFLLFVVESLLCETLVVIFFLLWRAREVKKNIWKKYLKKRRNQMLSLYIKWGC